MIYSPESVKDIWHNVVSIFPSLPHFHDFGGNMGFSTRTIFGLLIGWSCHFLTSFLTSLTSNVYMTNESTFRQSLKFTHLGRVIKGMILKTDEQADRQTDKKTMGGWLD